jgi:hypothetical protein
LLPLPLAKREGFKMAILMPRDEDILKVLSSGPMRASSIIEEMSCDLSKDSRKTDDKTDPIRHEMSSHTFYMRIGKLRKDDYVISKRYGVVKNDEERALYAVGKRGVDFLINELKLPKTFIRNTFPKKDEVDHDLHVVDVVKKWKSEAVTLGFKLEMMDENYLKRNKMGPKKKKYYPDVYIQMIFDAGDEWNLLSAAVEIDNGTMGTERMFKKAKSIYQEMAWVSFILVPSEGRLDTLRVSFTRFIDKELQKHEVAASERKVMVLENCAMFGVLDDFLTHGLLGAEVIRYDGARIMIVPDDYIPIR